MPYGDGTGPAGQGPKTGQGLGYCAGYKVPGYRNKKNKYAKLLKGSQGKGQNAGRNKST